jgi:hypothetical protein
MKLTPKEQALVDGVIQKPIAGRIHVSGKNIKLSRSEVIVGSAPLPGQHTAEILTSLLHYTPAVVIPNTEDTVCQ